MTIPYLSNCPHSGDGWCLACVRDLAEDRDRLRAEREQLANLAAMALSHVYQIGYPCRYWPGAKEGPGEESKICTRWWTLSSGEIVVGVEGYPGGIAGTHVEVEGIPCLGGRNQS